MAEVEASPFTADAILEAYEDARALAGSAGVELVTAVEGEFLIGDAPAQTLLEGSEAVGPLGGMPWKGSSTICMPVTRRHAVALGPADDAFAVGRDAVDDLNRRQSMAAHQFLAWHPDADLRDLAAAARASRSPGGRVRLPADVSLDLTRFEG